jgi:hypothetical protein
MYWERRRAVQENKDLQPSAALSKDIRLQITSFRPASTSATENGRLEIGTAVVEIYRHALLIYLYSAFYPVTRQHLPEYKAKLEEHANLCLDLLLAGSHTSWMTIFLWPGVIAASCLQDSRSQEKARQLVSASGLRIGVLTRAMELLEMLWGEGANLGPYGLHVVVEKNDFRLLVA